MTFRDRADAGRALADALVPTPAPPFVVGAIPRGGVRRAVPRRPPPGPRRGAGGRRPRHWPHDARRPRVRAPTRGARRYRGGALRLRAGRGRIRARRRSLREPRRRPGVPGRRAVLPRLLARAGRRGARDARVWVIRTVASVSVVDDIEAGC